MTEGIELIVASDNLKVAFRIFSGHGVFNSLANLLWVGYSERSDRGINLVGSATIVLLGRFSKSVDLHEHLHLGLLSSRHRVVFGDGLGLLLSNLWCLDRIVRIVRHSWHGHLLLLHKVLTLSTETYWVLLLIVWILRRC